MPQTAHNNTATSKRAVLRMTNAAASLSAQSVPQHRRPHTWLTAMRCTMHSSKQHTREHWSHMAHKTRNSCTHPNDTHIPAHPLPHPNTPTAAQHDMTACPPLYTPCVQLMKYLFTYAGCTTPRHYCTVPNRVLRSTGCVVHGRVLQLLHIHTQATHLHPMC